MSTPRGLQDYLFGCLAPTLLPEAVAFSGTDADAWNVSLAALGSPRPGDAGPPEDSECTAACLRAWEPTLLYSSHHSDLPAFTAEAAEKANSRSRACFPRTGTRVGKRGGCSTKFKEAPAFTVVQVQDWL